MEGSVARGTHDGSISAFKRTESVGRPMIGVQLPVPLAWGYSYRTSRYRFIRWAVPKRFKASTTFVDLFDLETDPGETRNIASLPSSAALVVTLKADAPRSSVRCMLS